MLLQGKTTCDVRLQVKTSLLSSCWLAARENTWRAERDEARANEGTGTASQWAENDGPVSGR